MNPVMVVRGKGVAVWRDNIDTDQIIPAVWMKRIERTGYEDGLFERLREDPTFPLNRPEHEGAAVLIGGSNFGCGSSREHAPWAIRDFGFKVVVAPSFADIFRGNLGNIGLIPARVDRSALEPLVRLTEDHPAAQLVVDLEKCEVRVDEHGYLVPFEIDAVVRDRLLAGRDLIGETLLHESDISEFEARRPTWMPKTTSQGGRA